MPKISTIITSFNRPEMLERAIKSVQEQTFDDWQLIIIDHSNKENKIKIDSLCNALQKEDKRIVYVSHPELSDEVQKGCTPYAMMINKAFVQTTGEYITYLCDDDWYLPPHFKRMLETIQKHDAELVYTGLFMLNDKDDVVAERPAALIRRCMFFTVDHNCIMHKREVFDRVGGWSEDLKVRPFGDAEFFYRLAKEKILAYPTLRATVVKTLDPQGLNATGGDLANGQQKQKKEA